MTHSAAVVGLGNIGLGYDYDREDDMLVLTHARGFDVHPDFHLLAGVDPDPTARKRFERKFQKPAYSSIDELFHHETPVVVSIAVPTIAHLRVVEDAIVYHPRLILCEKPLAPSAIEGDKLRGLSSMHACPLLVNFIRRFEPGAAELRKRLIRGEFGEISKGIVWYSKGILNNGSHYIDFLNYLTGEMPQVVSIQNRHTISSTDAKADFTLSFGDARVHFIATDHDQYVLDEIDLITTRGRIRYEQGGKRIKYFKTSKSKAFPAFYILDDTEEDIPTDFDRYQYYVADAVSRHISNGDELVSDVNTAMTSLRIVDSIINRELCDVG